MAILNDLAVDVAFVRDLCYGNSVTVLDVLSELHELQLRHCLISVPQSKEEIGDSPSSLRLRLPTTLSKRPSGGSHRKAADGEPERVADAELRGQPKTADLAGQTKTENSLPSDEEVCCRFRIFDMKDVLYLLDEELRKEETVAKLSNEESTPTKLGSSEPSKSVQTVLSSLAWQVANISGRNNYKPVWANSTLKEIIASFQTYSRVPIFEWNAEKNLLVFRMIFSATDLFKMLCRYFTITGPPYNLHARETSSADPENPPTPDVAQFDNNESVIATAPGTSPDLRPGSPTPLLIRALVRKTQEIKLEDSVWFKTNGKKTPLCVAEHATIRTMIRLIAETGYSAIPLMTDDDDPVGVISTSDFRLMMLDLASGLAGEGSDQGNTFADDFQSTASSPRNIEDTDGSSSNDPFERPIISYLSRVKRVECFKTRYPLISSRADSTIMQIVHRLAKAQIHRILIMADSNEVGQDSINKGGKKIVSLFSRTDFGKVLAALLVEIDSTLPSVS